MGGNSWKGTQDPATARAKAFENLQEIAAGVEAAQKRLSEAVQEKNSAESILYSTEEAYRKAKAELEDRLPRVSEPPEMHPT